MELIENHIWMAILPLPKVGLSYDIQHLQRIVWLLQN